MALDSSDKSPVLCTYVPTRLEDEFDAMLRSGTRSWSNDDLRHVPPWAFSRVASGALLVVGHRGPDSHVRKGGWSDATIGQVVLGVTANSCLDTEVFHLAFAPFFHGVRLGGDHLGPSILEALRLSAHQYGRPIAPADTGSSLYALARLIDHYPHPSNAARPVHTELVELIRWRRRVPGHRGAGGGRAGLNARHLDVPPPTLPLPPLSDDRKPHHE